MYFDDFLTRLKKGDDPRVVLLFGDSESVISEAFQALKNQFKKSKPGGTIQVFEGVENRLSDILSAAQTTSLFSSSQLLVLKHAEKSLGGRSDDGLQQLKEYFANPNPESTLVFLASGMRKNAKAVGAVERLGWAVQCSDMPDWKIAGWVKTEAQAKGLTLSEEAVQILVQKAGVELSYLSGRCWSNFPFFFIPKRWLPPRMSETFPVPGLESDVFPFVDAVALRQIDKALRMMGQLQDGVDTGTLMLLYGRFRELLMIAVGRAKGWGQTQVGEQLGLNPYRLKILWDQSSQFTVSELKDGLRDLVHIQAGVVTGRLSKGVPEVLLELWVLKQGEKEGGGSRLTVIFKLPRVSRRQKLFFELVDKRGKTGNLAGSGIAFDDPVGIGLVQNLHGGFKVLGGFLGGFRGPDGLHGGTDPVLFGRIAGGAGLGAADILDRRLDKRHESSRNMNPRLHWNAGKASKSKGPKTRRYRKRRGRYCQ